MSSPSLRDYSTLGGNFPSVVVTSMVATTSLGEDLDSTWKNLLAGESGIRELTDDFITKYNLPVRIGGRLLKDPSEEVTRVESRRMAYVERIAHVLSKRLWTQAGEPEVDPDRLAVVIGTGQGGGDAMIDAVKAMEGTGNYRKVSPLAVSMAMPNGPAAVVGLNIGARAGVITPVSACSSGAEAIAHAWRHIVMGDADMVVTGGVEGQIDAVPIAAFSMMRAMSTRNEDPAAASRPFDKDRDGFVFGEGAAMLILEREEHARARGARIHARLLGSGITSDGFHLVAPDPSGQGNARAMTRALQTAGLQKSDITHINAHATSTPIGDTAEAAGITAAIGQHAAIYAPKSALGHSIGAVGALESVLTIKSVEEGVIPPTLNLENQDPECDIDVVHGEPRYGQIDYAINNSFGFGGHNVALAFGRY
ncbi:MULTISPECIES: KasA/KasB family beta-ketoacyl-ACP synthase [Gordonia]|jgi:beta-ketoacyl ACP synthase|uniref:3-oxoacyl-[acyl-carrier-protein] synthase II n=2 Tax=Gordonia alkanivorans TaxID=84096 RepID=F9VPR1_9ACTN|nr:MULTISPECIES: KasA/KasB family beta-ketoacyl-ACP synthase [Gordonia]ETA05231.1 3-oxoacyl-ACP synthase [Gordonia alkanivorans CGMCC 6845]MDH3007864.1 KasA/KasB family beta-ketoacyl-ACP synthase [Gordonia alkanivorans]MDH3011938.1 KasA/KasB family beta-ketoacyl-ACP synthase [Gordonia alkanivorans]MDH3016775.1 KasA/KasB family beta-ketoacyl-ACP synthase [Gordonia alkanivorans]MDH3022067.1 KasA/KasB family beta-ketoacyl-ACP synthase [Gordonia alkanivorans]